MGSFLLAAVFFILALPGAGAQGSVAASLARRVTAAHTALSSGNYAEAIELFELLVEDERLEEEARASSAYNLACTYSLKGELGPALRWLERSRELGSRSSIEKVYSDPDLVNLRADPRFDGYLKRLELEQQRQTEERVRATRARRASQERANERLRSSPVAWLDGHLGVLYCVSMSPDGERAATWAQDGSAWLWNAWTGEPVGLLGMFAMGEGDYIEEARGLGCPTLEFSSDGERILLFDSRAGVAGLWDGRSAEFLGLLESGEQALRAAAFSPDGRRVATADEAGLVLLFGAEHGLPLDVPALAADGVSELSFSPDGTRLLALTERGRALLWNAQTGALLGELGAQALFLTMAFFSADGTRVLAKATGAIALVYDVTDPARVPNEPRVLRAPAGSWVDWGTGGDVEGSRRGSRDIFTPRVLPRGDRLIVVLPDRRVSLWDADSGTEVASLSGIHIPPVNWVGFSPDGERLLTLLVGSAQLWSTATGEKITDLAGGRAPFFGTFATFSPSGRRFATSSFYLGGPGIPRMYDGWTGELIGAEPRNDGAVADLDFGRDERLAITSGEGGTSKVWDGEGPSVRFEPHVVSIVVEDGGRARLSPDGTCAASFGPSYFLPGFVRVWDVGTGATLQDVAATGSKCGGFAGAGELFHVTRAEVTTVAALAPGGVADRAGLRAGDRIVKLGDTPVAVGRDLRRALEHAPERTTVVVVRSGVELELPLEFPHDVEARRLGLSLHQGQTLVELRDARSGAVQRSIVLEGPAPSQALMQILASSNGSRLVTRTIEERETGAALFDLTDGRRLATLAVAQRGALVTSDAFLHLVAMSPKGDIAAVVQDTGVRLWDVSTGAALESLPGEVRDIEFSADGRRLAGASIHGPVLVFDVETRTLERSLAGHRGEVRFVAVDPSGRRIVSAGVDGTARVFDLTGAGEALVLAGHGGLLNRPAFSTDGARVLTTSDDGTARVFDAATGEELAVLEGHVGPVTHGEFSVDGSRILTLGQDATTRIWSGRDGRLLATRVEYDDGWLVFEPGGHYVVGGRGDEHAQVVVNSRRYPLSSYAAIYEAPGKVAESLAGKQVRAPSFVPQAPEVRIAAPLDPLVPERTFSLEVLIEDAYGIESVYVEQDGRELDAEWVVEHLTQSGKTARLSCELELPDGANQTTIKLRATNVRKIRSAPRTVFARWQPPQRELYLLALGVADYDDDSLDLAYPTKDADDLIARFTAEQGGYYKQVNAQRLVNGEVTPGKLRRAREEFLLRAQPEDTIVVFAAGHGVRSESGEYYFLTPGTTPDDPYDGIERQVLESLVTWDRLHAKRRILLLDTCHSGEAFGEGKRGVAVEAFDQSAVNEAAGTGLYIIAASSEQGFAQELQGNGLFTRCLIEGLDGAADANGDGLVGIDELKIYATTTVHERSGGRQRPTAPKIEGGEDFPLARRR